VWALDLRRTLPTTLLSASTSLVYPRVGLTFFEPTLERVNISLKWARRRAQAAQYPCRLERVRSSQILPRSDYELLAPP
jgi:hypothetical protein